MYSSFPHKSEQILFSVFRLCSNFCGKLLHIKEKNLHEWLPGIMRRYVHFIALYSSRYKWKYNLLSYMFGPNIGTKFREPYHSNHVISRLVKSENVKLVIKMRITVLTIVTVISKGKSCIL